MEALFVSLFSKIAPLYVIIMTGFLAGRFLQIDRDSLARLVFYMITPFVIFNGVLKTTIHPSTLLLPLVTLSLAALLSALFYSLSKKIWQDKSERIIAFASGSANVGYFGLPIALLLFDDQGEGVYIIAFLGLTLFEVTIGFYRCARGQYQAIESVKKVFLLPTVHAFFLGLLLNFADLRFGAAFDELMVLMKGAYSVMGMMLLGMAMTTVRRLKIDWSFTATAFLMKFIAWPALMLIFILLDKSWLHCFSPIAHSSLFLISIMPLSINTVVMALLFNAQPEKAATTVLLSTLFAFFYVPFMLYLWDLFFL